MDETARILRAAGLAALLAAAACSGDGGGGTRPLDAPAGLGAARVPGEFDQVALTWTAPRTWDDVEVQVRIGDGAWATQPYRIPANAGTLVLAFPPDVPELTPLAFRARTLRGGDATAWSAEAAFFRGVRPPSGLAIAGRWDHWEGPVLGVGWRNRSLVADRVTLERQLRPASGGAGPWVEVLVPADATAHDDVAPEGWGDFGHAAYRVTAWAGTLASEPVEAVSEPAGVAAPRDLVATVSGSDVHVAWVNASTAATRIDVNRWKEGVYDSRTWTLGPSATSVDDALLSPGLYQYLVQAVAETGYGYLSDPARVAVVMPAASHAETYPARALHMPLGSGAARLADGTFAIAGGTQNLGTYPSHVFAPEGAEWERFTTMPATKLAIPGPLVDASGTVHAVYLEEVWNGASVAPVRHVWRDPAGWHSELLGVGTWNAPSFALAPDGSVHAAWRLPDGKGFGYATDASGTVVVEEVRPGGGVEVWPASPLVLDGSTPRILVNELFAPSYGAPRRVWLASRDGGTWSAEEVPGVATIPDGGGNLLAGGGTVTWIYGVWTGFAYDVRLRERAGGTWGAEVSLASTATLPLAGAGVARSPDGTRIAVALPGRDFPYPTAIARLVVREGGAATVTDLLPSRSGAQVGFTPEGKVWLLDGLSTWAGDAGTGAYVLYEER